MEIRKNYPLRSLNTFNLNVDGKYYTEVASLEELEEALAFKKRHDLPALILGGGSNILFTRDFPGLVIHIRFMGKELLRNENGEMWIKAGAGEPWDDFVSHCVDQGFGGLENLSLIPGTVGASPVQNIGAYGVEMKDRFESLEYFEFASGQVLLFTAEGCRFGYRNSIFKQEMKDRGIVLSVTFRLSENPLFDTSYGAIGDELKRMGVQELSLESVRNAVINIRRSKLPDPAVTGNAGSFFKNPTVDDRKYQKLLNEFPDIVSYPQSGNMHKLAAGWLIDRCGWKGYREGDAGVHDRQALVIVNHGEATGEEIFRLSERIRTSVLEKFGIELEREVNVI